MHLFAFSAPLRKFKIRWGLESGVVKLCEGAVVFCNEGYVLQCKMWYRSMLQCWVRLCYSVGCGVAVLSVEGWCGCVNRIPEDG